MTTFLLLLTKSLNALQTYKVTFGTIVVKKLASTTS